MIRKIGYKKFILLAAFFNIISCGYTDRPRRATAHNPSFYELGYQGPVSQTKDEDDENSPKIICPVVNLENTSYSKLILNMNDFQVNLVRDESYCNISPQVNRSYVEVTPIFQVKQSKTEQTERKVGFSYYVKTPDGRTRLYEGEAYIPKMKTEICYKGKTVRINIPEKEKFYYPITVGLIINPQELKYNNKYFNHHYGE